MNIIEHNKIIAEMEVLINTLINEQDEFSDEEQETANKLDTKISDLERRVRVYKKSLVKNLPYKKMTIEFNGEVKLSVRSSADKIDKTLKGVQYFDVVGAGDGYIILKNKYEIEGVAIKLNYKKLERGYSQYGKVQLIYNKYNDFIGGVVNRSGDEKDISYKILKLE